jgi:hypothetical protein
VAKPGAAVERNQVNLIILNEANRQDAETLLARFQGSLDSPSSSPTSSDHLIPLGASGDFILSPFTLVVMTGNSPRDDLGRIEQSRPFQRRISLVHLPNPLANAIATETVDQFRNRVLNLWNRAASESLLASNPKVFQAHLSNAANESVMVGLQFVLQAINAHSAGLSYGLLKKLLIIAANQIALTAPSFAVGE